MEDNKFMAEAVRLSIENVEKGTGGPFGAVIVKDGEIIARGQNHVTTQNDPSAHAEIVAIREACRVLNNFQLDDCDLYTSCEPCPMCLGAIYWARPRAVYFMHTRKEAADGGFDDDFIYEEIKKNSEERKYKLQQIIVSGMPDVFSLWKGKQDKVDY